MIVVDSSAVIAILEREPDAAIFAAAIQQADRVLISAVNVHECGAVLRHRHGMAAAERFWHFIKDENDFEIVPFDENQAREALVAYDRYGKGIDSKAKLNLSDCAAYALAKCSRCALLFKGDDFTHTDVESALSQRASRS
jgi:ribonuclease VapC